MKKRKNNHYQRPGLSSDMIYQLESLFEFAPPDELREHLIDIYHHYIIHEHEHLPLNFKRVSQSMQVLFELLKSLDAEMKELKS